MVEKAREITGEEVPAVIAPRRAGDAAKIVASSGLARELLGWKANFSNVEFLISSTWCVYKNLKLKTQ